MPQGIRDPAVRRLGELLPHEPRLLLRDQLVAGDRDALGVAAQLGGFVIVMLLSPFMDGSSSLAKAGGFVFSAALAGGMLVALLGAWGALWIVNRWRDKPAPTA